MFRNLKVVVVVLLLMGGCSTSNDIQWQYGRRRGAVGGSSVNGTGVLAQLFVAAGHRVTTRSRLSPSLERANAIVWAPNDFQPPTKTQIEYLEQWLEDQHDRTLVYIGRDYDAEPGYWEKVSPRAHDNQVEETLRRFAKAKSRVESQRGSLTNRVASNWFVLQRQDTTKRVTQLHGPWAERVSVGETEISVRSQLATHGWLPIDSSSEKADDGDPDGDNNESEPVQFDHDRWEINPLLHSADLMLAFELTSLVTQGSKIIVVSNGSFLLNLPLVNHEHRKLANKLVEACDVPGRVVFLESEQGGPSISKYETHTHHLVRYLTIWPLNCILLHFIVVGIAYCFSSFPIFGQPKELPAEAKSDFGAHVRAVGRLLSRTGDTRFAETRLAQYREVESGVVADEGSVP